jgi:hypothetical protein
MTVILVFNAFIAWNLVVIITVVTKNKAIQGVRNDGRIQSSSKGASRIALQHTLNGMLWCEHTEVFWNVTSCSLVDR